ncbi:AMP-binding protein [Paracoccus versutus]|uniref:Medium-chain acyl-CoA synthetase n=1 Tax=Paracoccus versutus TaxID=34007 RepID=A0A3D9XW85_PARVE|nr:AMP-binding protein [Paracoccus versutus]REF73393.1 medium-chain acyl-CoA synthetase [Paracoccus versutus]WGR54587.1 acyl-CoA synthetase [Paracoccus versutus]
MLDKEETWKTPAQYNFARDSVALHAQERGDARALLWVDAGGTTVEINFRDMNQRAERAAAVLRAQGVRRGDTVLILLGRELAWWELMLGCMRIGAIASPGTIQLMPKDIYYRRHAANARCIIASETVAERVDTALVDDDSAKLYVGGTREGWASYDELFEASASLKEIVDTEATDPLLCYFTSGTTGQPKMAVHGACYPLGHRITAYHWLQLGEGDLVWNLSDTGWAKAAYSSLFGPWLAGAGIMAYHAPGLDSESILELLQKHPVTTLCAPPTAYRMFVRSGLGDFSSPTLRHCVSAGEPLNSEVIDLWKQATGLDIYDGYGQTETVILCCNRPGAHKQGTMGKPTPGFDLAVIDENGNRVAVDEEGDIALWTGDDRKAPGLFLGYRDDQARTESVYRGSWYVTGDRAIVDAEGFFWFVGRADDVILTSGYRIGPFEVESALFEHPAVAESAVVASPDPARGEIVKAFVILAAGYEASDALAKEIQDYVKHTTAPYKYPRKIEFVTSLPKTISGKIRRKELREREWRGH